MNFLSFLLSLFIFLAGLPTIVPFFGTSFNITVLAPIFALFSTTIGPSITYLFGTKVGAVAINLQKPVFITGSFSSNEGDIKQRSDVWQLAISLRFIPSTNS